jgi:hypothetical protein
VIDDVKQWLPPSSAAEASKMRTNFSLLKNENMKLKHRGPWTKNGKDSGILDPGSGVLYA